MALNIAMIHKQLQFNSNKFDKRYLLYQMGDDFILKNFSDDAAFDEDHREQLTCVLIQRPFKRNEILIKAGEQARYMMFVKAGYLMTSYTDSNGSDHVIQFTGAGWPAIRKFNLK